MNAQDKVRVAIRNLLETENQIVSLQSQLVNAMNTGQHRCDEVRRILHSALGDERAAKGVVFAGERWWLDKGVLNREPFTSEVL